MNNNFFNTKRFGTTFASEFGRFNQRFGLSLIICGLLPIIGFIFYQVFSKLLTGDWAIHGEVNLGVAYVVAFLTCMVVFPVKMYGDLTEKGPGSDYILTPASAFEKWLSMIAITCVVAPVILFGLLILSNLVMGLIFPETYGNTLMFGEQNMFWMKYSDEASGLSVSFSPLFYLYLGWLEDILFFTLGAICFKRSKVAKTFLCLVALGMLFSSISMLIFGRTSIEGDEFFELFGNGDPQVFVTKIKLLIASLYTIVIGGLGIGLYFRIKTIKH